MPETPHILLDGTMPRGTLGPITINGVAYEIERERYTPNFSSVVTRDSGGLPNREKRVRQQSTLELQLQLATPTTAFPPIGARFDYTPKSVGTAINFKIIDVPEERNNEDTFVETVTIQCNTTLNPSNYSTVA